MTARRSARLLRVVLAVAIAGGLLGILRPWTVVPIKSSAVAAFDPGSYVASIWTSRVLPTAERSAIELRTFMQSEVPATSDGRGAARRAVFVKGQGVVTEVDTRSRIGVARLRLPWSPSESAAVIQVGPVFRGTALRDALDFIRFSDFVNQLEFAGVANALNERVATGVLGGIDVSALARREVSFVGAVSTTATSPSPEIIPVQLRIVEGGR